MDYAFGLYLDGMAAVPLHEPAQSSTRGRDYPLGGGWTWCPRTISVGNVQGATVGIELELHSGRPMRGKSSRTSLLRRSYEHGEALARALGSFGRTAPGKLAWVDPYGDTLFNEQEAQAALREVAVLSQGCADGPQQAALHDLAALLAACAATPGSYLWFMGD
ncbi:hypothetical protein ABIA33_003440 [Streptacidiphilus sp. MAP12-16]|uniref:hypothetical protein n=1 Tax=Streptacidiphilus sp. MAP12-16 TaxID=3156300 RepID=UPI0035195553